MLDLAITLEVNDVGVGNSVVDGGEVAGPGLEVLGRKPIGSLRGSFLLRDLGVGSGLGEGSSDDGEGHGELEEL